LDAENQIYNQIWSWAWEDEYFEEVSQCPKNSNEGKNGILSLKQGRLLESI
jgi:hypothetical protein